MSISRKNWSALSSLTRQWTVEDEEEVEREKRRRVKSSTSTADPDAPGDSPAGDEVIGSGSTPETSQGLSSIEQVQLDFVEMLRVRDEKRRMRHVETLRRQKEAEEDGGEVVGRGGGGGGEEEVRVELLGEVNEEQDAVFPPAKTTSDPEPSHTTASYGPNNNDNDNDNTRISNRRSDSGAAPWKDPDPEPVSRPARKFVSSVSISLDKSPSSSGCTSPMSPGSPAAPLSPRGHRPSPCQSPPPSGAQRPVENGHTQETGKNGSVSGCSPEQTSKPAFIRQSSRTVSFRMMRKKEEESSPLQRSASVRAASKKFESNTDQNGDEDKSPSFLRNSRQRISSRSIQEKMERLAQAAQKSEMTRSPDVTQRTLFLMEEVSRKRGLFEKEEQKVAPASHGASRQDFRSLTSGISHRINRWLNKTTQPESSHSPADLRHVDITSKRSLFEKRANPQVKD